MKDNINKKIYVEYIKKTVYMIELKNDIKTLNSMPESEISKILKDVLKYKETELNNVTNVLNKLRNKITNIIGHSKSENDLINKLIRIINENK